ncbi:MAG: hypothetical protein ABI576_16645 [Flavobacterium sp.]
MSDIKYYADLVFRFLVRKKYLHKIIGYPAFLYLVFELGTPKLSPEVLPDYNQIKNNYGQFPAMILNYFIDKNASGADILTVYILLFIVCFCLYAEIKINAIKSGNNNYFFGLFQNINQTFNGKE